MSDRLQKRSVTLAQHRTSIALEPAFWDALTALADLHQRSLAQIIAEADAAREPGDSLASQLRLLALSAARDGAIPAPVRRHQSRSPSRAEPRADPRPELARAARRNGSRVRRI